ncbi:MAG: hypothetical protein CL583_01825 [Alteromonadaceae bacterium]|nr:hypothetical protein [Alteromonadaceae bacterium]
MSDTIAALQQRPLDDYADKPERYRNQHGDDWIDDCARTMTPEEFRGAMKFTLGKYIRRAGKKDEIRQEIRKIADYAQRWLEYESGRVQRKELRDE